MNPLDPWLPKKGVIFFVVEIGSISAGERGTVICEAGVSERFGDGCLVVPLGSLVASVEEEAESVGSLSMMVTGPPAYVHPYGKELAQRAS